MAEDKKTQKPDLLAIQLPPLMPLQIYGSKGEACEPEIPKEVEPCRGEIPFSEAPYIPLPPKEELPEIDVQPEEDFCVEIVEAPYLEKPTPEAFEIPVEMPLEQVMEQVKMEDIPFLPKPQPTLPNLVNAVVKGLRAWNPSDELVSTIAGIKTSPATVGQLSPSAPPRRRIFDASVERRVFTRQSFPFWVIDFGNQIIATFGYETGTFVLPPGSPALSPTVTASTLPFTQGPSLLQIPTVDPNVIITPFEGPLRGFTNRLSSTTYGVVRDATIAFDPFCSFSGNIGDNLLTLRSYALSVAALKAGQVTIFSLPFPTVLPVTSAIKMVGGSNSFWTSNFPPPTFFNLNQMAVSEINESTHQGPPAPIEIYLPPAGRYAVEIQVPSRPIYSFGAYSMFGTPLAAFWSGTLTLTVEEITMLGAVAIQERPREPRLRTGPGPLFLPVEPRLRTGPGLRELSEYGIPPGAQSAISYRAPTRPPPYSGPPSSGPTPPTSPKEEPPPPVGPTALQLPSRVPIPTPVRSLRRYLLCWDKEKKKFEKKPINPGVVCDPGNDTLVSGWADEIGLF